MFATLLASVGAQADAEHPAIALGASAHVLLGLTESCSQDFDVVECTPTALFAGGDLDARVQVLPAIAAGIRFAASRDLDRSEGAASGGMTYDPEEQRLWRTAAELRLYPLPSRRDLWLSLEAGWARLR